MSNESYIKLHKLVQTIRTKAQLTDQELANCMGMTLEEFQQEFDEDNC